MATDCRPRIVPDAPGGGAVINEASVKSSDYDTSFKTHRNKIADDWRVSWICGLTARLESGLDRDCA